MRIIDILNAKESLTKLNKVKFSDFKIASNVYKLTKQVNNVLDMVQQEQQKIIDIYVLKDANGKLVIKDNQYQFASPENRNNFIEEIEKLKQTEINDISKINISINTIQFANDFSGEELMILEPFINWLD